MRGFIILFFIWLAFLMVLIAIDNKNQWASSDQVIRDADRFIYEYERSHQ